uniref:Uncharacterized protein n=1 Tax=Meloidogyne enterolobii TaxID=390850 RepID=A0A6V7TNQ5_MELEN|nr:unnamed protein product [Meloidogyne enterolobii]
MASLERLTHIKMIRRLKNLKYPHYSTSQTVKAMEKVCEKLIHGAREEHLAVKDPIRMPIKCFALLRVKHRVEKVLRLGTISGCCCCPLASLLLFPLLLPPAAPTSPATTLLLFV